MMKTLINDTFPPLKPSMASGIVPKGENEVM